MQIGELFILRINIHLNGSVLDTPELFWVEPQLEPVYQAVRSYLEMDQRVGLLTERLDVIADLLAVLKDQLSHGHGEKLEWIGECHGPWPLLSAYRLTIRISNRPHCRRDSRRACKYYCRLICRRRLRGLRCFPNRHRRRWRNGLSVISVHFEACVLRGLSQRRVRFQPAEQLTWRWWNGVILWDKQA